MMSCLEWMYIKCLFKCAPGDGCPVWYRLSLIRLPYAGTQKEGTLCISVASFLNRCAESFCHRPC